jgi:hypothetical protein
MKIIAYDHFKPGVAKESIKPNLLKEEMTHAWRLQKAGVIREIYGRVDAPGAVIVFECGCRDPEQTWGCDRRFVTMSGQAEDRVNYGGRSHAIRCLGGNDDCRPVCRSAACGGG